MFKLESYITPLILSRVEKYVKNVRTEGSQVIMLQLWLNKKIIQVPMFHLNERKNNPNFVFNNCDE